MTNKLLNNDIEKAVGALLNSKRTTAFTGAGISVESGIPPFRGENGLWSKFDPEFLDINYFLNYPDKSWKLIKEIFYDYFGKAQPNDAHKALANMQTRGLVSSIITQNIDGLHQQAGSDNVYEFHGNSRDLICINCSEMHKASEIDLSTLPPKCNKCGNVLKPDFIFFGEPIPEPAQSKSLAETKNADVFLVIGTTGEIMPASMIPIEAKKNNKTIIEINTNPSNYTYSITDIFIQGKATEVMNKIITNILNKA